VLFYTYLYIEQPFSTLKPVGKIRKALTKDIDSEADGVVSSALGISFFTCPGFWHCVAHARNFCKYIKSQ